MSKCITLVIFLSLGFLNVAQEEQEPEKFNSNYNYGFVGVGYLQPFESSLTTQATMADYRNLLEYGTNHEAFKIGLQTGYAVAFGGYKRTEKFSKRLPSRLDFGWNTTFMYSNQKQDWSGSTHDSVLIQALLQNAEYEAYHSFGFSIAPTLSIVPSLSSPWLIVDLYAFLRPQYVVGGGMNGQGTVDTNYVKYEIYQDAEEGSYGNAFAYGAGLQLRLFRILNVGIEYTMVPTRAYYFQSISVYDKSQGFDIEERRYDLQRGEFNLGYIAFNAKLMFGTKKSD